MIAAMVTKIEAPAISGVFTNMEEMTVPKAATTRISRKKTIQ